MKYIPEGVTIEVTRRQFNNAKSVLGGGIAHRTTGHLWWKKYFIKLMVQGYEQYLRQVLFEEDSYHPEKYFETFPDNQR